MRRRRRRRRSGGRKHVQIHRGGGWARLGKWMKNLLFLPVFFFTPYAVQSPPASPLSLLQQSSSLPACGEKSPFFYFFFSPPLLPYYIFLLKERNEKKKKKSSQILSAPTWYLRRQVGILQRRREKGTRLVPRRRMGLHSETTSARVGGREREREREEEREYVCPPFFLFFFTSVSCFYPHKTSPSPP